VTVTSDTLDPCVGLASAPTPKRSDPHRVDLPSAGRGTADSEKARVPDFCSSDSCEPGASANRGFGRGRRPLPFRSPGKPRVASFRPCAHVDDLAPASARRAHEASNRNLQSTNVTCARDTVRCTRFGRAGPQRRIRRAPLARTLAPIIWRFEVRAGDGLQRAHRGAGSSQPNGSSAAAKRHPCRRSTYPDGDRSIRPRVCAPHLSVMRDSRRERREPPFQPLFLFTDGWFGVPNRCPPRREQGPEGHSITSVITTASRTRSRSLQPRSTLGAPLAWSPRIDFDCGRLRNDHPKATARCRRCLASRALRLLAPGALGTA
jgi:hypothetical protein